MASSVIQNQLQNSLEVNFLNWEDGSALAVADFWKKKMIF